MCAGLQSHNWPQKVAAAASLSAMCEAQAPTLAQHAEGTTKLLLVELPGRIWAGKEALLDAAGALGSTYPASVDCEVRLRSELLSAPQMGRLLLATELLLDAAGPLDSAYPCISGLPGVTERLTCRNA